MLTFFNWHFKLSNLTQKAHKLGMANINTKQQKIICTILITHNVNTRNANKHISKRDRYKSIFLFSQQLP